VRLANAFEAGSTRLWLPSRNGIRRTSWISLSRRPKEFGVEANGLNEEVGPLVVEARELAGLDALRVAMPASHAHVRSPPREADSPVRLPPGGVDHYDLLKLFEHPAHDAGAERASSASNHPLRYSRPMLGAEFFGPSQNRTCSRIEPFPESPVISRGVIGTFSESNGKSHWRNSNHASVRPELVRILHVLFPLS